MTSWDIVSPSPELTAASAFNDGCRLPVSRNEMKHAGMFATGINLTGFCACDASSVMIAANAPTLVFEIEKETRQRVGSRRDASH